MPLPQMRFSRTARWSLIALTTASLVQALQYRSDVNSLQAPFGALDDRPDNCPPCFNCQYDAYNCTHFASCDNSSGRCSCPPGFGTEDCSQPTCGSLAHGKDRAPRTDRYCDCEEGWEGVNCNVCTQNDVCNALMPEKSGGVCYREGVVVNENFQMCNITNRKILDLLKEDIPQVTFSCNAEKEECGFQFWVDQKESFYCGLDTCEASMENEYNKNSTNYRCENIQCKCIPGQMLCGAPDSIDLTDFLAMDIRGPATFSCVSTDGGSSSDGCKFQEPQMNDLIKSVFGDESILLKCRSGECLYETNVPGYQRPIKTINTPLIAGVIAGCALFVVAVILIVWYLSRRSNYGRYGPIHLGDESDDEIAKMMTEQKASALQFENVSYHLSGKQILSGIQGVARPGQVMAIMGASGAGKTTFLDILARKNKRGVVEGDFYVNGEKVSDADFKSAVGFVDQEDTMLPTLTVHETIMTSALLRLPRDMSFQMKERRVMEVERQLGILSIKDQLIGSEEGKGRGISGGEKRRVGIACELVTSPSVLFLDEPTSGLDAFNAFNVVECLVTLAKNYNRTVVFTIHQPRSNIVALFDQLVLLAGGKTVYSGEFAKCQRYFDDIGYSCPPGFNIADYLIDLTMHAGSTQSPAEEDGPVLGDDRSALTNPSSTRAVKSIASISNVSIENGQPGSGDTTPRSRAHTQDSVRRRQERQLFTRKKSSSGQETPRTDDESNVDANSDSGQQWLRLSRQSHQVPPQILDDPHQLPPPASGSGTDLDVLVAGYARSDLASAISDDIHSSIAGARNANGTASSNQAEAGTTVSPPIKGFRKVGLWGQFLILSKRTWRNLYRNPMLMLTHYAIAILLAVLSGYLFYGLTDDIKGFQNRLGLFFFVLSLFGFSTLTTLTVFSAERLLFLRERANGYYSPITYFAAKVFFDIVPLRLIPPIIMGSIIYPMVGLVPAWPEFLKFILVLVLFNFAAAAICLFIGIVFKDYGMANLIGSLVMLFSLLFAGLLLNHDAIPGAALWLQSLSIFHYGFEALIVNEATYLTLIDHKYGIDIEVPGASILSSFGFNVLAFWRDVIGLAVFTGAFVVLAYTAMHFLLVEKR